MIMYKRNSSVELLRIILMIMIVIWHLSVHGYHIIATGRAIPQTQISSYYIFNAFTCCAVNCFMFISGFYGLKFKMNTFLRLLAQVYFYTLALSLISICFINKDYAVGQLLPSILFPLSNENWWFISGYIIIYVTSPIINQYVEQCSQRKLILIIIILYILFLLHSASKSSWNGVTNLLFIYVCGRYLQKWPIVILKSRCVYIFLFSTLVLIIGIIFGLYFNILYTGLLYRYWNPLVILSALSLFYIFQQWNFYNKFINSFAGCMLGVYLLTDFPPIRYVINPYFAEIATNNLICTIAISIFITIIASFIELARQRIMNPAIDRITKYYHSL